MSIEIDSIVLKDTSKDHPGTIEVSVFDKMNFKDGHPTFGTPYVRILQVNDHKNPQNNVYVEAPLFELTQTLNILCNINGAL